MTNYTYNNSNNQGTFKLVNWACLLLVLVIFVAPAVKAECGRENNAPKIWCLWPMQECCYFNVEVKDPSGVVVYNTGDRCHDINYNFCPDTSLQVRKYKNRS